ncbi:Gfo/Idh/MocA family protein [Roseivivax sp.]
MTAKMKAVMIGTGMVARTHVQAFADQEEVTLSGIVGRSRDRASAFIEAECGALPDRPAALTLEEVCADDSLDFAVITTPPSERAPLVEALASAGKGLLVEKPLERDLRRASGLVETCERAAVPMGVVLQHRMRDPVRRLQAMQADFGPLRMADIRVPWWRDQSYYDAPGRGTYARDGGGVLLTQAIHTLDLVLALGGPVSEVQALVATTGFHRMEAEDFAVVGLRFAGGAVGSVMATTAAYPGGAETLTLHYDRASVTLDAGRLDIRWQDGRTEVLGETAASGGGADPMAFSHAWHRDILTDFCAALRDGRPPLIPGRAALRVQALIEAIERSGRDQGQATEVQETNT